MQTQSDLDLKDNEKDAIFTLDGFTLFFHICEQGMITIEEIK